MANVKKHKSGVSLELPFKIVDGKEKYTVELNVAEMSFIANALQEFPSTKLWGVINPSDKKRYKKLFVFFRGILG